MSPKHTQKSPKKLVLHRETLRKLEDPRSVAFGPQTSCIDPCCADTLAVDTMNLIAR